MNRSPTLWLLTVVGFMGGWAVVRYWPLAAPVVEKAIRQPTAAPGSLSAAPALPQTLLARQVDARRRAEALTADEARAILQQLRPPVAEEETAWLREVISRWAEAEPEAAIEWLRAWSRHDPLPPDWLQAALTPLAKKDLRAALLTERHLGYIHGSGGSCYLAAAAERDPSGTMAFVEKNQPYWHNSGPAFSVWLRRDPAAACAWLSGSPVRESGAIRDIVADISTLAPDRLPALLAALPKSSWRESALGSLTACEVDRDPVAALQKFPALSAEERQRMLGPLTAFLGVRAEVPEVARFLAGLKEDEQSVVISELTDQIGYAVPERMLALLRCPGLTDTEYGRLMQRADGLGLEHAGMVMAGIKAAGEHAQYGAVNFWGRNLQSHPAETIPVLRSMVADGTVDRNLLLSLTARLSRESNPCLTEMIAALPADHRAAPQAFVVLSAALAQPGADLSAYTAITDAGVRRQVLTAMFGNSDSGIDTAQRTGLIRSLPPAHQMEAIGVIPLRPEDGPALVPLVEEVLRTAPDSSGELARAVARVASTMTSDSAAAMQWLDSLPAGTARDNARAGAFSNFSRQDAVSASAWLDAQPLDTPQRDNMVQTLVLRIAGTDPERAWRWAQTTQDPAMRQTAEDAVMSRWRAIDPEAARAASRE